MKISVQLTKPENLLYHGLSKPQSLDLDLEAYLCGVVPSEVYEGKTPMEALKAQAVAARTHALRKHLDGVIMDDTSSHQSYSAPLSDKSPRSQRAVLDTRGQVLMYQGQVIQAYYSNSNGGETKRTEQVWSKALPYYESRPDPWDTAARAQALAQGRVIKPSHGVGLSQVGAEYAAGMGVPLETILAFYYPGAYVAAYGQEEVNPVKAFPITVDMHTQNDCYKAGRVREKTHVIVHSTGTKGPAYIPRWQQWNKPGFDKCAHAFVDWNGIYQTLPWHYQGWLNGVAAGNDRSIAFEICEPLKANDTPDMARDLYEKTLFLCVHLCRLFDIPADNVICHAEAYLLGLANNHADVTHWWGTAGTAWAPYTMARLRADVAEALGPTVYPYTAEVRTKSSPLNIWSRAGTSASGRVSRLQVPKGDFLTVTGRADFPGWYAVEKGGVLGFADGQYLARTAPKEEAPRPSISVVIPDLDEEAITSLLAAYPGAYLLEVTG